MANNIGPQNPNVRRPVSTPRVNQNLENQKRAVESDISKAKTTNVTTLGRQSTTRSTDEKKATETPREKVSLSTSSSELERPETELQKGPTQESPTADVARSGEKAAASQEKSADDLKMDFLNTFGENLSDSEAKSIADKASASLVDLAASGSGDLQHEKVIAAHTYNHAKALLSERMPNASAQEIREAAKSDPEIAKAVQLLDSSSAYIKAAQKEEGASSTAPTAPSAPGAEVPGSSASAGAPPDGASDLADSTADPFAARRSSVDQPPDSGQPPEAGQAQNPYHLSPEKQAQMMAENHQTQLEIQKIFTQMIADMQKAAAQRHQIMMETATTISDMMMQTYIRRQQSHEKHAQAYLGLITGAV